MSLLFCQNDQDLYMSLKGLVNKNNGVYKSKKQRAVIERITANKLRLDPQQYGVESNCYQRLVYIDAIAQWAGYGSRSQVPVRWVFVLDSYGVVSLWKVGNKGNMRDGAKVDPSKTKVLWQRPADVDIVHLEDTEQEAEEKFFKAMGGTVNDHVGTVGKRQSFGEVTLVASKMMQGESYSYYDSGIYFWNMYTDAKGRILHHNGTAPCVDVGAKAILTATVKKHIVSKNSENVTVIARPKLVPVNEKEAA